MTKATESYEPVWVTDKSGYGHPWEPEYMFAGPVRKDGQRHIVRSRKDGYGALVHAGWVFTDEQDAWAQYKFFCEEKAENYRVQAKRWEVAAATAIRKIEELT